MKPWRPCCVFRVCVARSEIWSWLCAYCVLVHHRHCICRASALPEGRVSPEGRPVPCGSHWSAVRRHKSEADFHLLASPFRHVGNSHYCMCNSLFPSFVLHHANISRKGLIKIKVRTQHEKQIKDWHKKAKKPSQLCFCNGMSTDYSLSSGTMTSPSKYCTQLISHVLQPRSRG